MKRTIHFVEKAAVFFCAIVFFFTAYIFLGPLNKARALGIYVPYGGFVVSYVPPLVIPPAICPGHTLVSNASLVGPPLFGVYIPPFASALLYDYGNLYIPGTPLLGGYDPIPFPTCPVPYPVFPIDFDGMFYLTGTGF